MPYVRIILGYSLGRRQRTSPLVPVPFGWPSATLVSATLVRPPWRCMHGTEAAAAALSLRVVAARQSDERS